MQHAVLTLLTVIVVLLPALGLTTFLFACAHERGHLVITPRSGQAAAFSARVVAWAPVAFFIGFGILVAVAWIRHGAYPRPTEYRWDGPFGMRTVVGGPHASTVDPGRTLLFVLLVITGLSILLMPGLCAVARAVGRPTPARARALFYVSWLLLLIVVFTDPLDLLEWAYGD